MKIATKSKYSELKVGLSKILNTAITKVYKNELDYYWESDDKSLCGYITKGENGYDVYSSMGIHQYTIESTLFKFLIHLEGYGTSTITQYRFGKTIAATGYLQKLKELSKHIYWEIMMVLKIHLLKYDISSNKVDRIVIDTFEVINTPLKTIKHSLN